MILSTFLTFMSISSSSLVYRAAKQFRPDFIHGHPNVSYGHPIMDLLGDFLEHMKANPGRWDQDEWKDFTSHYQRHKIK